MSVKKTNYKGKVFEFKRLGKPIGAGGNGVVYDVKVTNKEMSYPLVAKFFKGKKTNHKSERYERFKQEIETVHLLQDDIPGIMKILDEKYTDKPPKNNSTSWYLMPKGEVYKVEKKRKLSLIIDEMLELANTIRLLHNKGYQHRDIKPENLIVLNEKILLSDFGLVWTRKRKRISHQSERIGPYRILPPELQSIDIKTNVDYRASDVYLFAKVLWMILKRNNEGFDGRYKRGKKVQYLDKNEYGVKTFEPIHQLIENSTFDEITERIGIDECITLMQQQKGIINGKLDEKTINDLAILELSKEFEFNSFPDAFIYNDPSVIFEYLRKLFPYVKIFVQFEKSEEKKQILATSLRLLGDRTFQLKCYMGNQIKKEFLFDVERMECLNDNSDKMLATIKLLPKRVEKGYVEFSNGGFESANEKIIIAGDYQIIVEKSIGLKDN